MGLFDSLKNIFSKSDKAKPKKKKKTAGKKAVKKGAPKKRKKKVASKEADVELGAKKKKVAKKKPAKKKAKSKIPFSLGGNGKARKKSKQVKADPINVDALGFSITLKGEDEQAKKRNAVRIKVEGLTVHIPRLNNQFAVTDISATGLGFAFKKPRVKGGVKLTMDLILNGEVKASGIECKVMRHERGSVGCVFIDLDRSQDDAVHEVVLLGQKQQSERKNFQKDRDFILPD